MTVRKPKADAKPRAKKPTFTGETEKADRFAFYANLRMNKVLNALKQIGSLGNVQSYVSTDKQREKMQEAVTLATSKAFDKLNAKMEEKKSNRFQL